MGRTGPGPIVARPIKNTNVRPVAWPRAKTSEFPRPGLPLAGPTQARPRPARAWPGLTLARGNTTQDIIDLTSVDESEDDDYTEVCCFKSLLHWILTGNVSLSLFL